MNVSDYDYERAQAALGVQLSRSFRLIGLGGRETDLLVGRDIGGLDSEFWEAGFRINAGSNSVVEFRTGERFFGDSYFGNIELEGRRVEFTTSYTENPTTSAEGMLGGLVIPFNPNPASSEDQEQLPIGEIILAPIRAEVYVSKMWRSRFTVNSARTEIYFSYFQEDRDFVDDLDLVGVSQDGQSSLAIGFIRELGPRTSMELVGRLFEYEYTDSDDVTQVASLEFGITRNIGTGTELGLTLRHAEQDTDSVSQFGNYVESAVDLRLVKTF